ncbi:MAG: type II secretion system F family protein [Lachnospiraceae bacterium]|nr:type II secretion system F family protein [Lachnospiraceae bacterium]
MADFGYVAYDSQGKNVKGTISAETIEQAKTQLKAKNLIITDINELGLLNKDLSFSFAKKVSARDLAVFCRQFVSMSKAGVSILECLSLLREQSANPTLATAIREVQAEVEKGETLASGLSKQRHIFGDLMITTVKAGEESGSLEISLERMADQFEKSAKTAALVKKAMIYPIIVALVAIAVVVVMLVVVIPSYTTMFADLGTELPKITQVVVAMSDFIVHRWFILLPLIAGAVAGLKYFFSTPMGKMVKSDVALKFGPTKNLTVKSACSQVARTMSTLLAAGVPIVDCVDIVSDTMQNLNFYNAMKKAKDEVVKGVPLSVPLEDSGLFPPMMYHMLRIGEEAGNQEEMLTKLADYYDEEVEMAVQGLMTAMEPMIILALAGTVGVLIAAVMAPMLTLYSTLDSM